MTGPPLLCATANGTPGTPPTFDVSWEAWVSKVSRHGRVGITAVIASWFWRRRAVSVQVDSFEWKPWTKIIGRFCAAAGRAAPRRQAAARPAARTRAVIAH